MRDRSTNPAVVALPRDLKQVIQSRVREAIEVVLEEELGEALGAGRHERTGERRGYRNGSIRREIVTEKGPQDLQIPRGSLTSDDGTRTEWRSEILPRYQRRTKRVDEAILGGYLAGMNTRRIRNALRPLLGGKNLSKSAVSRIVTRLKEHFEAWRQRDLSEEGVVYLYLDGFHLPVRLAGRVVRVPVQAALGVREDGEKLLVSLTIAASESTASWKSVVEDLSGRGLRAPLLVIIDGNAGLSRAVHDTWPGTKVQRCTKHKLHNLECKAPKHCHGELRRDYRAIIDAPSLEKALRAKETFLRKWTPRSKEVVRSLEEAGEELLSFYEFPLSQRRALRTTNPLERLNQEFRRRTKTQGSFTNEDSALVLLYGLVALEQIRFQKIDGWREMPIVVQEYLSRAA